MKLYALLVICLCIQSCLAIGWHAVWEYEGPNCMGKAKATLTKTAKGYNTTRCTPFLNNNNAATPMYAMTGCVDKGFEMIESFSVSTSATCDSSVANYTSPFGSCVTTSADSSYASQCTMDGLYNAEFLQVMGFTKATMYYTDSACTLAKAMKVVIESTTNGTDTECTSANYLKLSACKAVDGVYQNQLCGPVTDVFFFTQRYYNKNSWDLRHNFVFDAKFTDGSCQNQALTGISAKVTKVNSWGQCMKNPDSDVYARTMCGPLDGFQTHSAIYTSSNSDCSAPVVHSNTTQSVCLRGSTGSSITSCSTMLHPVISQSFLKGVSLMAGLIVFTDNWNCDPKVAQLKSFDFVPVANCSDYELPAKVGPIIPEFDYCFRFDPEYRIYVCDTPQKIFTKRLGFNFDAEAALFVPSASATSSPAATSSASSSDSSSSSASTSSASTSSSPSTPSPSSSPSTSSPSSSPSTSSPTSSPSTSSSPPPPPPVSETPTDAPSTSSSSLLVVSSLFLFSLFASLF